MPAWRRVERYNQCLLGCTGSDRIRHYRTGSEDSKQNSDDDGRTCNEHYCWHCAQQHKVYCYLVDTMENKDATTDECDNYVAKHMFWTSTMRMSITMTGRTSEN